MARHLQDFESPDAPSLLSVTTRRLRSDKVVRVENLVNGVRVSQGQPVIVRRVDSGVAKLEEWMFDHFVNVGVKLRRERELVQKSGKAISDYERWDYLVIKQCEYSDLLSFPSDSNVPVGAQEAAGFQRDVGAQRAASARAETRKGLANSGLQW